MSKSYIKIIDILSVFRNDSKFKQTMRRRSVDNDEGGDRDYMYVNCVYICIWVF